MFDCPAYQQFIARHLHNLTTLPTPLLEKGAYAVRLSMSESHAVALNECHKMCMNKNCKLTVVWPSKDRMELLKSFQVGIYSFSIEKLKFQHFMVIFSIIL